MWPAPLRASAVHSRDLPVENMLLPLLLALATPAGAAGAELELLRPDGKSFAVKRIEDLGGDEQVVIPDGGAAWQARFSHHDYDGRLKVCTELWRWGADGEQTEVTRACVVLTDEDTPAGTTFREADDVHLRLTVTR